MEEYLPQEAVIVLERNRRRRYQMDYMEMSDQEFLSTFRFSKEGVQTLTNLLEPSLSQHSG